MQVAVRNLAAEEVGALELSDAVFGVDVRSDILHRVVLWQLAKRLALNLSPLQTSPCAKPFWM